MWVILIKEYIHVYIYIIHIGGGEIWEAPKHKWRAVSWCPLYRTATFKDTQPAAQAHLSHLLPFL